MYGKCTNDGLADRSHGLFRVVVRGVYERRLGAWDRVLHVGNRPVGEYIPTLSTEAGGRRSGPDSRSHSVSSRWGERAVASLIASLHRSR